MAAIFDPRLVLQGGLAQGQAQSRMFDMLSGAVDQYSQRKAQEQAKLDQARKDALNPDNVFGQAAMYGVDSLTPQQQQVLAGQNLKFQSQVMIDPITKEAVPARRDLYSILSGGSPAHPAQQPVSSPQVFGALNSQATPEENLDNYQMASDMDVKDVLMPPKPPADLLENESVSLDQAVPTDIPQIPMPDTTGMSRAEAFEARKLNRQQNEQLKLDYIKEQREREKKERLRQDPREYTEGQLKSASFASRMAKSDQIINDLLKSDPRAQEAKTGLAGGAQAILKALPIGDFGTQTGGGIVKAAASPQQQQYLNAAENWIRANLRLESGAVIAPDEMAAEYSTYFPMPLDSDEVIKQKAELRKATERAVANQSAGAFEASFGNQVKEDPLGLFK